MPTLQEYEQAIGYALDDLEFHFCIAGGANTVTIPDLATAASNASVNRFDGAWVFNATQLIQRKVRTGGYAAGGVLTVDPAWTAPVNGDRIVITRLFPIYDLTAPDMNYRAIVRRALSMIVAPDRINLTIQPGVQSYSLATWGRWLDREDRLGWPQPNAPDGTPRPPIKILEPGPTVGAMIPADWRRPLLRLDIEAPYLEIGAPFADGSSGTFAANVMRPGDTLVGVLGAAYSESTTGLVYDEDVAKPSVDDVLAVGKLIAIEALAARGVTSAAGRWSDKVAAARAAAERVKYFDSTQVRAQAPAQVAA
jgi:hypothetical protein